MLQSFADASAPRPDSAALAAWIAGSVGMVGIFLAALGLYGLMAFLVTQRTREIAIRMALGASEGNMQSMVMKQAAWLGVSGVADWPAAGRSDRHAGAEPARGRGRDRSDRVWRHRAACSRSC